MDTSVSEITCRVCLNIEHLMISVFDVIDDFNVSLVDLLQECGGLKVDSSDSFPKYLCNNCTSELLVSAKFRQKCLRTSRILEQIQTTHEYVKKHDAADKGGESDNELVENCEETVEMYDLEEDGGSEEYDDKNAFTEEAQEGELGTFLVTVESEEAIDNIITQNNEIQVVAASPSDLLESEMAQAIPIVRTKDKLSKSPMKETSVSDSSTNLRPVVINCKCDKCGAGFMQLQNLQRHMITQHNLEVIYTCEQCSYPFSKLENYQTHYQQHSILTLTGVAPTLEEEETSAFPPNTASFYSCTVDDPPGQNSKRKHKCDECDKSFVSKSSLAAHIRIHTGDKPFKCPECLKGFTTQGGLDLHLKRHSGIRAFQCSFCNKTFVEKSNLKVHLRTHTGEKPHKCLICGRGFARIFLLQLHERTHTGEKPYQCSLCEKSFTQRGDLVAHERLHTGERPFKCAYCYKSFIKSSALTSHIRKHSVARKQYQDGEGDDMDNFET